MKFNDLRQGFVERTGAEDCFLLDADGSARIGIDGHEVVFAEVSELNCLLMWCDLGELPLGEDEVNVLRLLRKNFVCLGGGVLSQEESGRVVAHRYVPIGQLEFDDFLKGPHEEFLNLLSRWADEEVEVEPADIGPMSESCREFLAEFAGAAGIADFPPPGNDGVCRVSNGLVAFGFSELGESRELLVEAKLGALPAKGRADILAVLAQANFMGRGAAGGSLAVSDDDCVMLFRRYPLSGLTSEALATTFEGLAATAFEWWRIIDGCRTAAARDMSSDAMVRDFRKMAFAGEVIEV